MDFNTKAKDNLYDLQNGYYISKNDPLFWRKLLSRRPENEEAMYHVGLDLENDAKQQLGKYYTTNLNKHLIVYRNIIKQAFDLIKRSFNRGYVPARVELLRMEREIEITEQTISTPTKSNSSAFGIQATHVIGMFLIAILLGIVLTIYFESNKVFDTNTTNYINNHFAFMVPYEVIENKPNSIPGGVDNRPTIIKVKRSATKEALVNELVGNLKIQYERGPKTAIQVLAIDENKEEIGMALWADENAIIQVYIYPLDSTAYLDGQEQQLWETTTVVRSAVYQFVKNNGFLPKDLNSLTQPFPNNYLSELPRDPYNLKNHVTASLTGDGGWLFSIGEISPHTDLVSAIKEVVKPNILSDKDIPFAPMYIAINKIDHSLSVMSGNQIIRNYSTGLGKNDSTPEAELLISKKIMKPDKSVPKLDNVYGTRAMELSDQRFAIHGTNTPSSIGKDVSEGCIRLANADMEDLYAITPLNTPVKISRSLTTFRNFNNPDKLDNVLYNLSDNVNEEDNSKQYYWSN